MSRHILVLDEGTSSTRAVLFDDRGAVVDEAQRQIAVHTPSTDVVEQDAEEIFDQSVEVLRTVLGRAEQAGREIAALGVTNQRTTTVLWDRTTGEPAAPIVSWQDTRTSDRVDELREEWAHSYTEHTGLELAAANIPLHLESLLGDPELRRRAEAGDLMAGTPDSWLIWKLTGGPDGGRHLTSFSNAGSTGAFDLVTETWWEHWLADRGVPSSLFGDVLDDDGDYGTTRRSILGAELPIRANVADQQSALFGHGGFEAGAIKCTHGTGSFIDFNIGAELVVAHAHLDTRAAWRAGGQTRYLVEGSSFVTGSAIDWLADGIGVLDSPKNLDATYNRTPDASGVICIPALAGFTAPHWDPRSRGIMLGLHRGVTKDHVVKATVDGIARTVADLVRVMGDASGVRPTKVLADGGLSRSDALLQAQADFTGVPVERAADAEYITARGTAWIAGLALSVWDSPADAVSTKGEGRIFTPRLSEDQLEADRAAWDDAVQRALGWRPGPTIGTE